MVKFMGYSARSPADHRRFQAYVHAPRLLHFDGR